MNKNQTVQHRWERGTPHHPQSVAIMRALQEIDRDQCADYFDWRIGGDGDNGETLMYQLDVYFASKEAGDE